MTIKTIR